MWIVSIGPVILFVFGVFTGYWVESHNEEQELTRERRDLRYLYALILGACFILVLHIVFHTHIPAIAFICGILAWMLYDDYFSVEHGKFNSKHKAMVAAERERFIRHEQGYRGPVTTSLKTNKNRVPPESYYESLKKGNESPYRESLHALQEHDILDGDTLLGSKSD